MYSLLTVSFLATFTALTKVAIVIIASAWLVRRNIFNETHVRALSGVVVHLSLPCLVFANIIQHFEVSDYAHWWKFPLMGATITFVGLAIARLVFRRDNEQSYALSALSVFQNAGYLVLPIGEVLFPAQFERFSIYIFLLLLSYNPLLWSLASFLISHRKGMRVKWSQIITTPFCATVLAMSLVFTGLSGFVPRIFLGSVELVGKSCVPLATVVLGLTMGALRVNRMPPFFTVSRVVAIKLLIIPVLMLVLLKYTSFSGGRLEDAFWILEASSPPATALVLQVVHFGGDEKLVCGIMVIAYLIALFTIPLFYSIVEVVL
ncbi:MAG TPA: AEC family transporter [archaeon]|nr:AEC family transporter [archaeon]